MTESLQLNAVIGESLVQEFDDIPSRTPEGNLGSGPAEQRRVVGEARIGKAEISVTLEAFEWGLFEDKPACFVGLSVTSTSGLRIIKLATLEVASEEGHIPGLTIPVERVFVVALRPLELRGESTSAHITHSAEFEPRVETAAGIGTSIGRITRTVENDRLGCWKITGTKTGGGTAASFMFTEDRNQRQGVKHHAQLSLIFHHENNPFVLSFTAGGKTGNLGDIISGKLRAKREVQQRIFTPNPSAQKVFSVKDLEDFISRDAHT